MNIFKDAMKLLGSAPSTTDKPAKSVHKKSGYYSKEPDFNNQEQSSIITQFRNALPLIVVIAGGLIVYFILLNIPMIAEWFGNVLGILSPVIYGLIIAFLLTPLVNLFDRLLVPLFSKFIQKEKRAKALSRGIGVTFSLLLLVFIIVLLLNMLIPELYRSISSLVQTIPAETTAFVQWINQTFPDDTTVGQIITTSVTEITNFIDGWIRGDLLNQVNSLMTSLTAGVMNVLSEIFSFLIGLIISIYVLSSKEKLSRQCKKIIYSFSKPSRANIFLHITTKANHIFSGFIFSRIISSIIVGIICFIGMSILQMPYVVLVSVIVGVTNTIPFFGPFIGAIPSTLLILLHDPRQGVYFLIFIILLQQLDGNLIGPRLAGEFIGISPFWTIFAILLGGGLFGFVGVAFGVPTFAIISYTFNLIVNHKLESKHLPKMESDYDPLSYVDSDGTYVAALDNTECITTQESNFLKRRKAAQEDKELDAYSNSSLLNEMARRTMADQEKHQLEALAQQKREETEEDVAKQDDDSEEER